MADHLADTAARSILEQARQAYVAVAAPAGPHVTPELYSVADGRLWCWTAHDTVKAKVVADDPRVAAVVGAGGRSVLLVGTAERHDPKDLSSLPKLLRQPRATGQAAVRYGLRNAVDLGGFAGDLVRGRLGRSLPPRRVLLAIRPTRSAVLDHGRVVSASGWDGLVDGPPVTDGHRSAVVAWETDDGPVALPGRVDLAEHRAWVPAAVVAGLPRRARVGVVVDDYVAPGPAAKEGTLLRGTATLSDDGAVEIVPERSTDWEGIATRTRKTA